MCVISWYPLCNPQKTAIIVPIPKVIEIETKKKKIEQLA